jgi:site-specific recombinase XerD
MDFRVSGGLYAPGSHPERAEVLMVLYATGIRRTEASLLKVSDVDSERRASQAVTSRPLFPAD